MRRGTLAVYREALSRASGLMLAKARSVRLSDASSNFSRFGVRCPQAFRYLTQIAKNARFPIAVGKKRPTPVTSRPFIPRSASAAWKNWQLRPCPFAFARVTV